MALGMLLDFSEPVFPSVKQGSMLSEDKGVAQGRLIQWEFCLVFDGKDVPTKAG